MLNKENVSEVLKDVIYFPKGDNIIAWNMVEKLMVNAAKESKLYKA